MRISVIVFYFLFTFSIRVSGQIQNFIHADFNKADSVAALYPGYELKDAKGLVDKLTEPLSTEEEKFRAIYKWVCNNIAYDYDLFLMNKQKREKLKDKEEQNAWNKYFSSIVFKNLVTKQQTICTGYAYLIKELCFHAGLPCVIINGYGRTTKENIRGIGRVNHSWNAIQLNKKWYLCDATWSSGVYHVEISKFEKKFDASYFLPDPILFVRNHYPLDSTWLLMKHKPTLQEFLNGPLIYNHAYTYEIVKLLPDTFDITVVKGKAVSFQFSTNSNHIEKVQLSSKGYNMKDPVTKFPRASDTLSHYQIEHVFAKKGTHIVHILLNNHYTVTYTVKVR